MKYNAYIKNSFDSKLVDEQESLINDYISSNKITIDVKYYSKELHKYKSKLSIVDLINKIDKDTKLIIATLDVLGNTTLSVLKSIKAVIEKGIILIIISENLEINSLDGFKYSTLQLLSALIEFENNKQNVKLSKAKKTLSESAKKVGRKSGKKTTSIFDAYKKEIMKLYGLSVPKIKILKSLQEKDKRIKQSSSQALGLYIKKVLIQIEKNKNVPKKVRKKKSQDLSRKDIDIGKINDIIKKNLKVVKIGADFQKLGAKTDRFNT